MYLKTIEIQGFKSFVGRTVFHFEPGITGIVGPNGSGKSNVADAVRWVLGEQRTSQLRSGSMQDVIFAGTENRKPLSYASVSLTIDNQDGALPTEYSEVTVTRKLYRSGESEYQINRQPCRLRDIQELFYDTGVGREGYSLIGQGQIDRIISGNPIARRDLFDEAAGIVKYKKRKESALKKLEEEQNNLVRVDDILSELSAQVGPLKEQSEKAVKFLRLRDELKQCELNRFLLEMERTDKQIQEDQKNLQVATDQMKQAEQAYEMTRSQYSEVEEQITILDEKAAADREKLTATDKLKTELEGQIRLLHEQINSALTSREHFKDRQRDLEGSMQEAQQKLTELTDRYEQAAGRQKELSEKNDRLVRQLEQSKVKKDALKEEQENTRLQHLKLVRESGDRTASREKNDATLSQLRIRTAEETAEIKALEQSLQELQKEADELSRSKNDLEKRWNQSSDQAEMLKKEEETLTVQKSKAYEAGEKATAEYQKLQTRLTALRNLTERYEGFGESVKRVMDLGDSRVCGVVADLIRTPAKYTEAIETALGRSLRYVVTKDEETARDLITFLKKNRYGRATFIPLTAVTPSVLTKKDVLREKGVIGTADSLVESDDVYRDMVSSLLGRTVVVDELDHAIRIAQKYGHTIRMVTLEGDQLSPGGTLSGGAYRNSAHLLSRRNELDELSDRTKQAQEAMEACRKEDESLGKKLADCRQSRENADKELQQVFVSVRENEIRLTAVQDQLRTIQESLTAKQDVLSTKEAEAKRLQEEIDSIMSGAASSEDQEKELARRLAKLEEEVEAASDDTRRIAIDGENAHAELAACTQSMESLKSQIIGIRREQETRRRQMDELGEQGPDTTAIVAEKEAKIADLQKTIDSSAELFEEIRAEIAASEEQKAQLMASHRDALDEREKLARERSDLEKEILRLNHRIESADETRSQLVDYMWEEYELTYHHAKSMQDENMNDLRALRKRTGELKHDIRELGDVNVNAIEQYREVGNRFETMTAQREDIMKAEEAVLQVIDELDDTMRAQFDQAFGQINKQFNDVFRVLFGGGRGRLELIEEDILSAGVRVIAQPPGKKLQNMMQLSGGEKSLTAIALLFAIQNLHPSPFCLLDEIEASLDDRNVGRFSKYLRRLTKQTQFIVITHRHGTMNAADRLYGITMQEKGVSTMVSVDLAREQIEEQQKEK